MPLLKRKAYALSKPPDDLQPRDLVFQVRFTKEIFKNYTEYLQKVHFYTQRFWTCKVTGKSNLTYEEALASERQATEKVQKFPKEYIGPVLTLVQFSDLRLDDLVKKIMETFKERFVVGDELLCNHGNSMKLCRVVRVIENNDGSNKVNYEVLWLCNNKNTCSTSIEAADKLSRKKNPFSKALLKSFIRESTRSNMGKNLPWMVHDKLCHEYHITKDPPEELKQRFATLESASKKASDNYERPFNDLEPQLHVYSKRRKKNGSMKNIYEQIEDVYSKRRKKQGGMKNIYEQIEAVNNETIRYPIDDSLLQIYPGHEELKEKPILSFSFSVPMGCIGPLLMVWNFCDFFSKAIHLYPFSLEQFEDALLCTSEDHLLLRETHHALLQSALGDPSLLQLFAQKRKRKVTLSLQTWKDDLSDFLELECCETVSQHSLSIREGRYRKLELSVKLDILCELVSVVLTSNNIRDHLDQIIEEKQAISAQKRLEVKKANEISTKVYPEENVFEGSTEHNLNGNGHIHGETVNKVSMPNGLHRSPLGNLPKERFTRSPGEECKCAMKDNKKSAELLRRQDQLDREIEKRTIRINPLGMDRDYKRYWFFSKEGRIFVEDKNSCNWGYYSSKEELDALHESLNPKGIRERALQRQLEKNYSKISDALLRRSKDIAHKNAVEESSVRRSSRIKQSPHQNIAIYRNKYRSG